MSIMKMVMGEAAVAAVYGGVTRTSSSAAQDQVEMQRFDEVATATAAAAIKRERTPDAVDDEHGDAKRRRTEKSSVEDVPTPEKTVSDDKDDVDDDDDDDDIAMQTLVLDERTRFLNVVYDGEGHVLDTECDVAAQLSSSAPGPQSARTAADEAYDSLRKWLKDNEKNVTRLRRKYPVPEFDDHVVFFEEEHYYTVKGLRYRGSGTGIMHSMFDEFDEIETIDRILKKWQWRSDPTYKYYQMSGETISKLWEVNRIDASERGTAMHAYIEYYYNELRPEHLSIELLGEEYGYFYRFHREHVEGKLEPFRTELILFDEDFEAVGTIDMLYRRIDRAKDGSEDHILIMYDWKRSKEIRDRAFRLKEKGENHPSYFGKGPCQTMENCNKSHYFIQLNIYKYIIEKNTKYRVDEMYLGVFHPNHGEPKRIPVPNMQREAAAILQLRRYNLLRNDRAWMAEQFQKIAETPLGQFTPALLDELKLRWEHLNRLLRAPEHDPLVGDGIKTAPFNPDGLGVVNKHEEKRWRDDE